MDQDERRAVPVARVLSANGVTEPGSAPPKLALLESLQPVFAVCHH
jgi:hypothetical protein